MRTVFSMMALGVFFAASGSAYAQGAERGAKVFAESKCSMCHSVAGKGNAKGVLDGVGAKLKADEIRQWIVDPAAMSAKTKATRKPPMKSYASMAKEDVDALVAYLMTLKGK
jgi:mono/diheme cytochrome c family protein